MTQNSKQKFGASEKKFILLSFTRELIRHSGEGSLIEIENILKKQSNERHENIVHEDKYMRIIEKIKRPEIEITGSLKNLRNKTPISPQQNELVEALKFSENKSLMKPQQLGRTKLPPLRIPMQKLPLRFQYLRPTSTKVDIDLGKLNPLLNDPLVKNIECNGVGKNIIVEGTMGRKQTAVTLDRKEIENVIHKFSETAKIPISEGIFKVAVGRFIFSAIVSEVIDSKFVIKKIAYNPNLR